MGLEKIHSILESILMGNYHKVTIWQKVHNNQLQVMKLGLILEMHHGHGGAQAPQMRNADKKFSPALLVFRQFTALSPALAFRHRVQSGTASHGLARYCPATAVTCQGVSGGSELSLQHVTQVEQKLIQQTTCQGWQNNVRHNSRYYRQLSSSYIKLFVPLHMREQVHQETISRQRSHT